MFDDAVSIVYLLILCLFNLSVTMNTAEENEKSYIVYVFLFLGLSSVTLAVPFIWFWMFGDTMNECEDMIRNGQALYMSAANDRLVSDLGGSLYQFNSLIMDDPNEKKRQADEIAVKSFWLYGRTSFRGFFHRLAWTTNFGLLMHLIGPIVAYFLIIERGVVFDTANILVILLSLKEMQKLSTKLLDDLIKMSRGCNVLRDVSELLNAREITDDPLSDMEKGCVEKEEAT